MSGFNSLRLDIKASLGSIVALDRSEEDMQNLSEAHGKTLKPSDEYIPAAGNPHKIQNLVDDISDILAKDEHHSEDKNSRKEAKKKNNLVKSRDYLGDKKYRMPSAAELMNNPLRDSFLGLESGKGTSQGSYHDFSRLTAKDLSKSVNDNLNVTSRTSTRKGIRDESIDVKKSLAQIINSTLTSNLELANPSVTASRGTLGVTANDLARATRNSFEDITDKKLKKKSSPGSIGVALNEPFRQSMEGLGIADNSKKETVIIGVPNNNDMYVATKENHRKYAHEKI